MNPTKALMIWIIFLTFIGFLIIGASIYVHKDDMRLKAECEAAGGLFIQAREPMTACVKEIKRR